MPESFYFRDQYGQVLVREGASRRRLELPSDPGERSTVGPGDSRHLSLALLSDALENKTRALRLQARFNERVVAILPHKWTITRSRILAYANTIEMDELGGSPSIDGIL